MSTPLASKAQVRRNADAQRAGRPSKAAVTRGAAARSGNGFLWLVPALVVSVAVVYYCIGYTGYISTLDWDGVSPEPQQVGIANYAELLQDPVFWQSLAHTLVFFVVTFTVQVVLGMTFAVLLHSKVRLAVVYKVLVFVPVVLAPATMAPVFRQMFAPDGDINALLHSLGMESLEQPWLANSATALAVVMAMAVWQSTGVVFVLYFAAISQVDPEVLEAARLDGAGNLRVIWSIVWPSVRGTTVAIAILTAIGSLKTFDIPYLVTQGGPNYATEFLGTQIYRVSVAFSQAGYGAAISIVLLVLALAMAIVLNLRGRERARKASHA